MGSYKIEWKRTAIKELKALPRQVASRVVEQVGELSMNPYPHGVKKLSGTQSRHTELGKGLTEWCIPLQKQYRSSRSFESVTEKMSMIGNRLEFGISSNSSSKHSLLSRKSHPFRDNMVNP